MTDLENNINLKENGFILKLMVKQQGQVPEKSKFSGGDLWRFVFKFV